MKNGTREKPVTVHSIIDEALYVNKIYPEFVLISHTVTHIKQDGKRIPCDVLVGQTNDGIKEFWFDISSFYTPKKHRCAVIAILIAAIIALGIGVVVVSG